MASSSKLDGESVTEKVVAGVVGKIVVARETMMYVSSLARRLECSTMPFRNDMLLKHATFASCPRPNCSFFYGVEIHIVGHATRHPSFRLPAGNGGDFGHSRCRRRCIVVASTSA